MLNTVTTIGRMCAVTSDAAEWTAPEGHVQSVTHVPARNALDENPAGQPVGDQPGHAAGPGRTGEAHVSEHSSERSPVGAGAGRPGAVLSAAGDLLRALAAPVRIAIVLELREHDRCVHELVEALGVAQPLISQHLRVLKSAGVVRGERHGREVVYSLVDEHLAHIVVDAVAHVEEGS
jgi:ArsR family transcriptional regulator, zinc-responsive transcriptional repressor